MNDNPIPGEGNASATAGSHSPETSTAPPSFTGVQLKGVGGWLLFFVIGQLALRPLLFLRSQVNAVATSEIAERFPVTAKIITFETVVQVGLLIFGILVGCALLRTGATWPVLMAKVYLIANALLNLALAASYFSNDLPDAARNDLIFAGVANGSVVSLVCLLWFLYFTKSKRVQATYFSAVT